MSVPPRTNDSSDHADHPTDHAPVPPPTASHGSGHSRMMWLMCLPMVVVAIVLMATSSAGVAALLPALLCIGMMAAMMRMHGGGGHH